MLNCFVLFILIDCSNSKSDSNVSYCFDNYPTNTEWGSEAPLVLNGYTGNANEPRIYPDSNTIFFNDKPASGDSNMKLHWASRDSTDNTGLTWNYMGQLNGANANGSLNGTPSVWLDSINNLVHFFFVSTRAYDGVSQFGMIYSGDITVTNSAPFLSVSTPTLRDSAIQIKQNGHLDMDVDVSYDGNLMIVSRGVFSGGAYPDLSTLAFFPLDSNGQAITANDSQSLLMAVNDPLCRVYAGSLSADKLELYYSAFGIIKGSVVFHILVAKRSNTQLPFGAGQIISAINGDVTEGPSISQDSKTLYYHKKKADGTISIFRVIRP